EACNKMLFSAEDRSDARGGGEFVLMALAVIEGERIAGESIAACEREAGSGIESAAQQADRLAARVRRGIGHAGFSIIILAHPISYVHAARYQTRQRNLCRDSCAGAGARINGARGGV